MVLRRKFGDGEKLRRKSLKKGGGVKNEDREFFRARLKWIPTYKLHISDFFKFGMGFVKLFHELNGF
jgi:hypothetical protein